MRPTAPRRRSSFARAYRQRWTASTRRLDGLWRESQLWTRSKRRLERGRHLTSASNCGRFALRSADERNLHWNADHVLDLNLVTRLNVAANGFGADAGIVNLSIRIVDVGEEHVPRNLPVDAHRLDAFQYSVPSSLEHLIPQQRLNTKDVERGPEPSNAASTVSTTSP